MLMDVPEDCYGYDPEVHKNLPNAYNDIIISIFVEAAIEVGCKIVPGIIVARSCIGFVNEAVKEETRG